MNQTTIAIVKTQMPRTKIGKKIILDTKPDRNLVTICQGSCHKLLD